jgi:hypothetical protein
MAKKSKKTTTTKEPTIAKAPRKLRESELREEFRKYFIKLNKTLKLGRDMENVLWLHLKSTDCTNPELFSKGVENFGYKI